MLPGQLVIAIPKEKPYPMKQRNVATSIFAALAMVACLCVSGIALAQNNAIKYETPQGTLVIPASNIEHPGDAGVRMHTNIRYVENLNPSVPPANGETPASLACVYHFVKPVTGCPIATTKTNPTGGSKVVAIVDAYDNPDAAADLATYSAQWGLPAANFSQVYATGVQPANDPGGWSLEEALDIEMAHAMAPNAQIILVEAASNNSSDLYFAEQVAAGLVAAAGGGEISNSWSGGEYSGELSDEKTYFSASKVVYFASTGDSGLNNIGVPAVFANVVAAGGTDIFRTNGNFIGEQWWSGGGGGASIYEPLPSYQKGRSGITGTKREIPDISADADPFSGPAMYDADAGNGFGGGWIQVGGTSVSSPLLAGIVNRAGKFNTSTQAELTMMYNEYSNSTQYKADFRDITRGGSSCKVGWDVCTGIGSPKTYAGK